MTNENQKRDYQKFFIEKGEPGFSAKKNDFVIESTIKKAEKLRSSRRKKYNEALRERASAVESYLSHLARGGSTSVEKYFGRAELARLQSQKILQRLQGNRLILDSTDNAEAQ